MALGGRAGGRGISGMGAGRVPGSPLPVARRACAVPRRAADGAAMEGSLTVRQVSGASLGRDPKRCFTSFLREGCLNPVRLRSLTPPFPFLGALWSNVESCYQGNGFLYFLRAFPLGATGVGELPCGRGVREFGPEVTGARCLRRRAHRLRNAPLSSF